jgi:hypothetical protein
MSSVVISGDTSGAITLAAPAVAGTNTITLPAAAGSVMVSGNMPAFSAWKSSTQGITTATLTKITFDTEDYDTANCFASSTFTPNVAGYYQVNAAVDIYPSSGNLSLAVASIYKNGTSIKYNQYYLTTVEFAATTSSIIYMNGSTDYIEIYGMGTGTSPQVWGSSLRVTTFSAALLRAA